MTLSETARIYLPNLAHGVYALSDVERIITDHGTGPEAGNQAEEAEAD